MKQDIKQIENVRENCNLLGKKLIESGEEHLGRQLIANSFLHDNSKFFGAEFDNLESEDKEKLSIAILQHSRTNPHHIEYWGDFRLMPRVYIAEMAADVCARASEFGTNVREWIDKVACKKYKFTQNTKFYKDLNYFINLILEPAFQKV